MIRRQALTICSVLVLGCFGLSAATAQGIVTEAISERTPTFTAAGTPGPLIAGRDLVGRLAQPEGQLGLMGVDTAAGHVLVRRSAIVLAPVKAPLRPVDCGNIRNTAPNARNRGTNGFGEGCPTGNP